MRWIWDGRTVQHLGREWPRATCGAYSDSLSLLWFPFDNPAMLSAVLPSASVAASSNSSDVGVGDSPKLLAVGIRSSSSPNKATPLDFTALATREASRSAHALWAYSSRTGASSSRLEASTSRARNDRTSTLYCRSLRFRTVSNWLTRARSSPEVAPSDSLARARLPC